MTQLIQDFVKAVRQQANPDCVRFEISITSDEYEVIEVKRDRLEMERSGVAMRNIAGNWVVSRDTRSEL